jgi:hypothetical protein
MPVNIDYTPIGLLGALAGQAGESEAQQRQQVLNLQQQEMMNRQIAQSQAFSLQKAHDARQARAQYLKSPVADHVAERATERTTERDTELRQTRSQLDDMLGKGVIDATQYQKGILALMTGNKELLTQIFAQPKASAVKPNISNAEEVSAIREPFREKRRTLEQELQEVNKAVNDPKAAEYGTDLTDKKARQTELQKDIQDLYDQEGAAIGKWRAQGAKQYAPTDLPESAGTATITSYPEGTTPQEQSIYQMAQQVPGAKPILIRGQNPTATLAPSDTSDFPPASQFPEGHIGRRKSTGQTFIVQNGQWVPQ